MQIPDRELWDVVGAIFSTAVALLIKDWVAQRRRQEKFLTRDEHKDICEEQKKSMEAKLDTIKENQKDIKLAMDRQNTETQEYRNDIRNAIHGIGLRVAVVQTKLGIPLGETGERG